ncbi:hypothetical protein [Chryseobacterium sp.]|jgi:hypothetical protein|uniref:hypothetical protein n=1 Tax=Chryseobacterium sp. TaxID=1871047 RepID=UPI00260B4D12|nr:hypothetical protein [Chryseobacterium sp.]
MKTKILLLLFLMITLNISKAQTAAVLLSGTQALDHTVNNALTKADNILSDQQRTLYVNLANYTAYLTGNLKYLSDDLDRKLTQKELAILNDINAIQTKLNQPVEELVTKFEDIAVIIESSSARIIGSDKKPSPLFYKIPLITTIQNKNIIIDVKGVRLDNSKNYIVFNGKKIPVSSISSDKLISFTIPLTEADVLKADTLNVFKLVLFKKRIIGKDKLYEFTPRFVVSPNYIGVVKVFYKVTNPEKEVKRDYSDQVSATSGSNNEREVHKQFNIRNSAADGWKIDRNSIRCWKSSGHGDEHGYGGPYTNTMTDISFVAKAYATDGRAVCTCKWDEYRYVNKESIESSEVNVNFNKQEIIQLPNNLVSLYKTEITYYDNSIYKSSKSYFKYNNIEFDFRQLEKIYEVKFAGN